MMGDKVNTILLLIITLNKAECILQRKLIG